MPTDRAVTGTAIVVGGGPAGLMAAEVLAAAGVDVSVFEHKASVGRKFLLAGRGGLNLTHGEDTAALLDRYGAGRAHLEPAITQFGQDDLRAWCAGLGEPTTIGTSGRVFPQSFRATPLLRAWLRRLDALGVTFHVRHRWDGWTDAGAPRFGTPDGRAIEAAADVTILALGGASWPRVGSDGTWVSLFETRGVAVESLVAANGGVRIGWTDRFVDRFAGEPVKNVTVTVDGLGVRGDVMVTDEGLEGGPIYAHSAALRRSFDEADAALLLIDLWPDLDEAALAERLTARRRPKDSLTSWLRRSGFPPVATSLLREATSNDLPVDPAGMAALAKAVPIEVVAMMPIERAISTAGGVSFDEIDEAFMLRKVPGCFVAGEMLDWEAPTGGYLLQACFSTAVAAAQGALAWIARGLSVPADLPEGLDHIRTTDVFDADTVPRALLQAHRIADGVWGRVVVHTGTLRFVFEDDPTRPHVLTTGDSLVIPPATPHHVELDEGARFAVEFHRPPR